MENLRFHHQINVSDNFSHDQDKTLPKAVDLLAKETQLSKQKIKLAMKQGAVWLTQGKKTKRLRRADKTLMSKQKIDIYYDEALLKANPVEPILVKDEGQYSIWYKPYGLLSQGSKWGDHHTINRYAEKHLQPQRPAFVVHRLDRAANGLMLLAHTKQMAASLAKLFQERNIIKYYQAIVHGNFSDQDIVLDTPIDNKPAKSIAKKLRYDVSSNRSLIHVKIESGRKHQIRKHLSNYGFPIEGDRLYGKANLKDKNLQLSAIFLSFSCPIQQTLQEYHLNDNLKLEL